MTIKTERDRLLVVLIIDAASKNIVLAPADNAVSVRDTHFRPLSKYLGV